MRVRIVEGMEGLGKTATIRALIQESALPIIYQTTKGEGHAPYPVGSSTMEQLSIHSRLWERELHIVGTYLYDRFPIPSDYASGQAVTLDFIETWEQWCITAGIDISYFVVLPLDLNQYAYRLRESGRYPRNYPTRRITIKYDLYLEWLTNTRLTVRYEHVKLGSSWIDLARGWLNK